MIRLAKRGAAGRLDRHGPAGIRTKNTRVSDETWVAAHRAGLDNSVLGGRLLKWSGVAAAALGLLIGYGDPTRTVIAWGLAISMLPLLAVVPLFRATMEGDRAAKAILDGATS